MVEGSEPKKETLRIHVPTRPPSNPAPADSPSPPRATAVPITTHSPKKETPRITALSNPPAKSTVERKETQPLIDWAMAEAPPTKVTVAPGPTSTRVDEIPMPLCWGLLAASAAILILQIWNYLS
jgi:hypothetical protein